MPSFREPSAERPAQVPGSRVQRLDVEQAWAQVATRSPDICFDLPGLGSFYGYGEAAALESDPAAPFAIVGEAERALAQLPPEAIWLGGFAFDPARTGRGAWAGFPAGRLVLPQELIRIRGEEALQITIGAPPESVDAPSGLAHATSVSPASSERAWTAGVQAILSQIAAGALHKAVLAREVALELSGELAVAPLLGVLRRMHPDCVLYALRRGARMFLGATPELLFTRERDSLSTMALAGTAPIDASAEGLLANPKERNEHALVADAIREALAPLARSINLDGPHVRKQRTVQHLETHVEAALHSGVSTAALLERLHPTPAVCGTPRLAARTLLRELEPFDRGWYAGPFGFIGAERAGFAVALRGLVAEGKRASLFAGAGIVAGSEPSREWRETELKLQAVLGALAP